MTKFAMFFVLARSVGGIGQVKPLTQAEYVKMLYALQKDPSQKAEVIDALRKRGIDFGRRDLQAGDGGIEPVEFSREIDQGMVAAGDHVGDHATHHLLDVDGRFALAAEKGFEPDSEIRGAVIEADRQRDPHGAPAARGIMRGNDVAGKAKSTLRCHIVRMIGTADGGPGGPQIGKLAFQALDLEAQHAAAGEEEGHGAGWRRGLVEFDGKQIEDGVLGHRVNGAALAGEHAIEA